MPGEFLDHSGMDDSNKSDWLLFLCSHLVALAGTYVQLDESGEISGDEKVFSFSGFVICVRDLYFFVTAGHILEDLEDSLRSKQIRAYDYKLVDDFGLKNRSEVLLPFDYESSPKYHRFDGEDGEYGVDFGLILLKPYYVRLLIANGVRIVGEANWRNWQDIEYDAYCVVGLPTKLQSLTIQGGDGYYRYGVLILGMSNPDPTTKIIRETRLQRVTCKIPDHAPINLLDGMSGGPVLGFYPHDRTRYRIAGVQSSIDKSRRLAFACPVPFIARYIEHIMDSNDDDLSDSQQTMGDPS